MEAREGLKANDPNESKLEEQNTIRQKVPPMMEEITSQTQGDQHVERISDYLERAP